MSRLYATGLLNTAEELREREQVRHQQRLAKGNQRVAHSYSKDGTIDLGSVIVLRHLETGCRLTTDIWSEVNPGECAVFAEHSGSQDERVEEDQASSDHARPMAKATFILTKLKSIEVDTYDRTQATKLHYGQPFQLACNPALVMNEDINMMGAPLYLKSEGSMYGQQHVVSLTQNDQDPRTHWFAAPSQCALISDPHARDNVLSKNKLVFSLDPISLKNCMTNMPLGLEAADQAQLMHNVSCGLELAKQRNRANPRMIYAWAFELAQTPQAAIEQRKLPARITKPKELLRKIKLIVCERTKTSEISMYGIREISREFRFMDTSRDGKLSRSELQNGLRKFGVSLDSGQLEMLFEHLDGNQDGTVDLNEFLVALRGPLTKRRLKIILMAYDVLDIDKSGTVTLQELAGFYDTSFHPEVIDGVKTHEDIIKEFIAQWDNGAGNKGQRGDGVITRDEFVHYYRDVSASIDDDDYFELMMRNAWHISGGEGWCTNTTNIRVLVEHMDGSQEVVEVLDDFGVSRQDMPVIRAKLRKQGVADIKRFSLAD